MLNKHDKQISLFEELQKFDRRVGSNPNSEISKELFGSVKIHQMPFELQEGFTRSKLNIPPHIWDEYDYDQKGKTIAIELIKSQLEMLERFQGILERNKKKKK